MALASTSIKKLIGHSVLRRFFVYSNIVDRTKVVKILTIFCRTSNAPSSWALGLHIDDELGRISYAPDYLA